MAFEKRLNNSKSARKITAIALFCLLILPLNCFAKTLAEYASGIESAEELTQELADYVGDVLADDEKDAEYEREILASIRKAVPATEKIEWEGAVVETGNEWLEADLKKYEETLDWSKRRIILLEISERLAAIKSKITGRGAAASSNRSKDEDKRKIGEILRRPEFQKPEEKQESWFERVQKSIKEWFDKNFPQTKIPEGATKGMESASFGLQILLYAIVLGFIAFVIYRFAPFFAARFRRRKETKKGERVILGEKLAADEDAQTLFDEADALARSGNLRGAIRKGYIALLCELNDRKIIGLAQHKTNRDYLRDVRKKGELYQNMNGLTNSFERYWYGFEDVNETDWNEFKRNYQKTISS